MANNQKSQPEKKTVYRRSDTGQWTDKDYAKQHPKTTEKERVRTGK